MDEKQIEVIHKQYQTNIWISKEYQTSRNSQENEFQDEKFLIKQSCLLKMRISVTQKLQIWMNGSIKQNSKFLQYQRQRYLYQKCQLLSGTTPDKAFFSTQNERLIYKIYFQELTDESLLIETNQKIIETQYIQIVPFLKDKVDITAVTQLDDYSMIYDFVNENLKFTIQRYYTSEDEEFIQYTQFKNNNTSLGSNNQIIIIGVDRNQHIPLTTLSYMIDSFCHHQSTTITQITSFWQWLVFNLQFIHRTLISNQLFFLDVAQPENLRSDSTPDIYHL
ncbi:unnamed protein product [Paramecium octaurelia]|uniref:Uncharacterized protein n=1 Tax=Paramecium octaurelia TaxID=43137 RepID=A0A8S1U1Z6_PAROT|nr:unnamed protein product [Paramecium octaurelia]